MKMYVTYTIQPWIKGSEHFSLGSQQVAGFGFKQERRA